MKEIITYELEETDIDALKKTAHLLKIINEKKIDINEDYESVIKEINEQTIVLMEKGKPNIKKRKIDEVEQNNEDLKKQIQLQLQIQQQLQK